MQKTLAVDGVEWIAADMTFDQDGKVNAIKNRTQLWAGTSGVWQGGVVTVSAGLVVTVSGTLKFNSLGEMGIIATPGALTAVNAMTNYVIATYGTTSDSPAAFYAGGSPPNLHVHDAPTVSIRQSGPAIEGNNEVNLATVVASGGAITLITDTRKLLPYYDAAAQNLVLGESVTIDGFDPSEAIGPGGATPYATLGGDWTHDTYIGTALQTAALDDTDFTSFQRMYQPTRVGDLSHTITNLRLMNRFTLTFHSDTVQNVTVQLVAWDDTVRLKANGTTLFSATAAGDYTTGAANQVFATVIGTNTIQVYQGNPAGDLGVCLVACNVLSLSAIKYTG